MLSAGLAPAGSATTLALARLAPALKTLLRAELEPGEPLVWLAQPIPRRFSGASRPLVLFGIPWTAFALFWMASAAGFAWPRMDGPASFFPWFGLPFVLIGLWMLSSPWWMRRRALRIAYAITDRRVLILEHGRTQSVSSYRPAQLGTLHRRQHEDGSGDLVLQRHQTTDSDGDARTVEVALSGVADVRGVERLVRRLAESGPAAGPQ